MIETLATVAALAAIAVITYTAWPRARDAMAEIRKDIRDSAEAARKLTTPQEPAAQEIEDNPWAALEQTLEEETAKANPLANEELVRQEIEKLTR